MDKNAIEKLNQDTKGIFKTKSGYKVLHYRVDRINTACVIQKSELWMMHSLMYLKDIVVKKKRRRRN